jgi:hypothetical protein
VIGARRPSRLGIAPTGLNVRFGEPAAKKRKMDFRNRFKRAGRGRHQLAGSIVSMTIFEFV